MTEPIAVFAVNDFAGFCRGRGVPPGAREASLEGGCGWVPADQAITACDALGEGNPVGLPRLSARGRRRSRSACSGIWTGSRRSRPLR